MKVTEKKKEANRKNAQKSTGPKTEQGKLVAAQNSIRNGLYTRALIVNSPILKENATDYNSLIFALDRDLQPEGLFEECLVRKIANCLWRMRRVIAAENARIERQLEGIDKNVHSFLKWQCGYRDRDETPPPDEVERARNICMGVDSIPDESFGRHLMRYEMRLDRQLTRTLKLLQHLQKRRKSNSEKEKQLGPLKMSKRTQISRNPMYQNPLSDINKDEGVC